MEPDLDRIVEFESGGGLFPQFVDQWSDCFAAAKELADRIAATEAERPRVAIRSADPLSFCATFLAFCRNDFDLLFYNDRWGPREIAEADRIGDPHWVIGDFNQGQFSIARRQDAGDRSGGNVKRMRVAIPTGGTSGQVRFAVHDWSTLAAAAYGLQLYMECNAMSSHCILPLYHVSGFMQFVRSLMTLGKIVFGKGDDFAKAHRILANSVDGDRFLSLVPTQLARLVEVESNLNLLSEYKAIFVGGAPISVGLIELCRERKLPVALAYGMSETAAQVATLKPEHFLRGDSGVGKALPHTVISIIDEKSAEGVGVGEIGRVLIKSTSLFHGYFGEDTKRSDSIVTSDLGCIDESGNLILMGRADGVINTGGEKVNPREIEICLEATNLLEDVAIFGVEDREWGAKVAVAFQAKGDFVKEEVLREALENELAAYKVPKLWYRVDRVPRNEAGKLVPEALAELVR